MKRNSQDAAYYEAHKDDPTLWGEPVEPAEGQRRPGLRATITVRFSAEEAEAIRHMAREANLTYSEVVRKAVQAFTHPQITMTGGSAYNLLQQYAVTHTSDEVSRFEPQIPATSITGLRGSRIPGRD